MLLTMADKAPTNTPTATTTPSATPRPPAPAEGQRPTRAVDPLKAYDIVSQTVGGVPSLRMRDNLIQAAIVIGGTLIGAAAGFILNGWSGAGIGAVAAMVGSTILSGLVLMVLGWIRVAKGT